MTRRQAVVGAVPVVVGLAPLANAALADSSPGTNRMAGMDGQMAEHHPIDLPPGVYSSRTRWCEVVEDGVPIDCHDGPRVTLTVE